MIKSQKVGPKQQINLKQLEYKLTISQVQILTQSITTQCYILLKSSLTGREWQSQLFYTKLPHTWTLDVDSPILILQLFNKAQSTFSKVAKCTLSEGNDIVTLSHLSKQTNKICVVKYELAQQQKSQKPLKGNHFAHDSNIFDQLMQNNQISRVEPVNNSKKNQQSFEKVRFNGYSYISSQIQQSQEGGQNNSQAMRQSNNHLKVINNNGNGKHNEQDERQRFEHTFNDTINMSLNDSKSDIKQIIRIIEPGKEQNLRDIDQKPNQSEDQFITTSEKWYKNRFNKKNMKLKKKGTYLYQTPQQQQSVLDPKQIKVDSFNPQIVQKEQVIRQLSDMSSEYPLRLKTIDFSLSEDGQTKKLYSLSRVDGKQSSLWYTTVSLPSQRTILVQCQSENGILNGCLGKQQIKKCQCPLYDQQGKINGNLSFKWKSICNFQVQTHQILSYNDSNLLQNQNKPNNKDNKQQLGLQADNKNIQNIQDQRNPKIRLDQNSRQRSISPIMLINFSSNGSKVQNDSDVPKNEKNELNKEGQQKKQNNQNPSTQLIATSQVQKVQTGNSTPPHSRHQWRKQRYFNKPPQEDIQSKNEGKIQAKIQTIESENSPNTLNTLTISQNNKNIEKQYQQSRFDTKKRRLSQYHTISEEIKVNPHENSNKKSLSPRDTNKQKNQQKIQLEKKERQKEEQEQESPPQSSSYRRERLHSYNPLTYNYLQESNNADETPVHNNSFSQRLDKYRFNRQSYNNSSRERSYVNYPSHIQNEEEGEGDGQNDEYKRKNYSQIARNSITSRKDKLLNFKISNIKLTLHKPIYNTKFIRMKIERKEHFTETTRDYCFMNWKGNGYVFLQVSEFSILYIDLVEEREDGQVVTGRCKIELPLLHLDSINKTFSHHDYLRKQNQQSVGRVQINYETFQRRGKSLQGIHNSLVGLQSLNKFRKNYSTIQNKQQVPKKKKNKRLYLKSQKQSGVNEARRIPLNLGKVSYGQQSNILSRLKNRPPLVKRKYTGGNTLIPKASRFRDQIEVKKFTDGPGPGAYQVQSSFDRHASPL